MRYVIGIFSILILISTITGCARTSRIANDVDWVVFDGEPSREN